MRKMDTDRDRTAPGDACLDAEVLAAWADDALEARERARVETHAADCERCQALLAAMVRTLPPPSAAASPLRRRALWWIAAAAPVAAALVVWFAVPARLPVARSESAPAVVDQMAPASPAAAQAARPADAQAGMQANVKPGARQNALAKEKESDPKAVAEAPAVAAASPLPGAAPAAVPHAAPATGADASLRREAISAPARLNTLAGPMDSVIVSSNPATRFRLLPGGGVQRSADGGATWRTEVTGVSETLTAGASPSPSVCWLIGRSGVVLLSTDGRAWRRLTFPEAVDLQAVAATDAEHAAVTAADGRAFVTADGGQTWSRAPNP